MNFFSTHFKYFDYEAYMFKSYYLDKYFFSVFLISWNTHLEKEPKICFVLFCFVIVFNVGHNTKVAHVYLHIQFLI